MPPDATLKAQESSTVATALRSAGLRLDLGVATIRVRGRSRPFAEQLRMVYGEFPFASDLAPADVHVAVNPASGWRRWIRPQVVLQCDSQEPFDAFPADSPLPMFEWGCNWLIAHRLHDHLLFHAGALERDGLALLLPATPGSGKSTLTAALSRRGWRLLSDEFGALHPESGVVHAILKPVALKNESIDVIGRFAPDAVLGPRFDKTRKGTVAHLAPSGEAVARRHESARPGAVVLPRWAAGSATRWEPVHPQIAFAALAFNAFNYTVLGELGFRAAVRVANECPAWQLVYSDLDDALATLERAWPQVVERASEARRAVA